MKPWRAFAVSLIWWATSKVAAQEPGRENVTPPRIGNTILASTGDVVWTKRTSASKVVTAHIVLDMPAQGSALFSTSGIVDLPVGSLLDDVHAKTGLRACVGSGVHTGSQRAQSCLIDVDADGKFDLFSEAQSARLAPLRSPAAYHWENDVSPPTSERAQFAVTYLGVASGSLSLKYEEIADQPDLPPYTESVSIPVMQKFPVTVHFRHVALKIVGVVDDALRYAIISVPGLD